MDNVSKYVYKYYESHWNDVKIKQKSEKSSNYSQLF